MAKGYTTSPLPTGGLPKVKRKGKRMVTAWIPEALAVRLQAVSQETGLSQQDIIAGALLECLLNPEAIRRQAGYITPPAAVGPHIITPAAALPTLVIHPEGT